MEVKNYRLLDEIGSGSYSTVFKAIDLQTNEAVAIKKMREMPRNDQVVVQNQINLLKRLKHKNIIRYINDFKEKEKWYIVFEYCGKGDLQKFRNKLGRLPEYFCKNLMFSLVDVLSVLHQNKIVHRDLKLANILINDAYDIKLADFGFSKDNQAGYMQSFCGTPYAMAPEILRMEPYDDKCDTWSLGVMLYQLLYGKLPFLPSRTYGAGIPGLANCILNAQPYFDPSIEISEDCLQFMRQCLQKEKENRPSTFQLKGHYWFKSGIQSTIRREFIENSMDDKSDAISKAQEILNGAVQEHIEKLIKQYKMIDSLLKNQLNNFDTFYKENKQTRALILLMISKIIKELTERRIILRIEDRKFQIPLKSIQSFQAHIKNLLKFLESELKYCQVKPELEKIYIERELFYFIAKEADSCLRLLQNFTAKNSLLLFISELPLNTCMDSNLQIKWSFNQNTARAHKSFAQFIDKLSTEDAIKFINQSYCHQDIRSNWLIEHEFGKQKRSGTAIDLGQFMHRVIKINLGENKVEAKELVM